MTSGRIKYKYRYHYNEAYIHTSYKDLTSVSLFRLRSKHYSTLSIMHTNAIRLKSPYARL